MAGKKDLRYKVRFLQRVEIKRAPDDKRVGGYAVDVIPAGAIRELKASSVNFWKSRASAYGGQDVIEVLGRVEPEPEHVPEPVAFESPFGVSESEPEQPKVSKIAVRNTLLGLFDTLSKADATLRPAQEISKKNVVLYFESLRLYYEAIRGYLSGQCEDAMTVIVSAGEDIAENGEPTSFAELQHAVGEVILKIWPSRIRK